MLNFSMEMPPYTLLFISRRKSAVGGITSGVIAQFCASPTDLVKVQIQMEGKRRLLGKPAR